MLRASSETHEQSINLEAVMDGSNAGEIVYAVELAAFAEAIVGTDETRISDSREALVACAGDEVMIDAAGIASNFQRMVRIADSTGIALGDFEQPTSSIRESLGINEFRERKVD